MLLRHSRIRRRFLILLYVFSFNLKVATFSIISNLVLSGLLSRNNKESRKMMKVMIDLVAIGCQATGFFIWPIVEIGLGNTKTWTVSQQPLTLTVRLDENE